MSPMQRAEYPNEWETIANAIKQAADWKCEQCGVAHGTTRIGIKGNEYKVVMTVAHLGENKHNKQDTSNLHCLCPTCHLREDIKEHVENAKKTRRKKFLETQPLLAGMEE